MSVQNDIVKKYSNLMAKRFLGGIIEKVNAE